MSLSRLILPQPRVLIDLFSSMMMNAFVLYKLNDASLGKKLPQDYSSLDFIADWLAEVAPDDDDDKGNGSDSSDENEPLPYKSHRFKWWSSAEGTAYRLDRHHYHNLEHAGNVFLKARLQGDEEIRCDLRRDCMLCHERTLYFCKVCNVSLCCGDCCNKWHTFSKLRREKRQK